MQRQPKIRWSKAQQDKLKRDVQRYNNKISREVRKLKKQGIDTDYLPTKISVKEMKKQITTARDLRNFHNQVERIFKPKALEKVINKHGVESTKYEVHELKLKVNRINRARAKEVAERIGDTQNRELGILERENLKPKVFNFKNITKRNWGKFKESVDTQAWDKFRQAKYQRYKENYLNALDFLGEYAEPLKEIIGDIDEEEMFNAQFDDPILEIGFISDPIELELRVEAILNHWSEYLGDEQFNKLY